MPGTVLGVLSLCCLWSSRVNSLRAPGDIQSLQGRAPLNDQASSCWVSGPITPGAGLLLNRFMKLSRKPYLKFEFENPGEGY